MPAVLLDANMEKLQRVAWSTFRLDLLGAARKASRLKLDLNGICRTLWDQEVNDSYDDLLALVGSHSLQALFGGGLSTPDHADFAVTDLDIRWLGAMPWGDAVSCQMIGQWPAAPNQAWVASIHQNKRPRLAVSVDGTTILNTEHNVAMPFTSGKVYWVRQTFDNRTTDRIHRYYWAPATATGVPTSWTEIGSGTVDSGLAVPLNSTGSVQAAWAGFGSNSFSRFLAAEVRNAIDGTIICNPDVRNKASGTTSFQDGTGKTWTVTGFGAII